MSRKLSLEDTDRILTIRENADKIRKRTGNEDVRELAKMIKDLTDFYLEVL